MGQEDCPILGLENGNLREESSFFQWFQVSQPLPLGCRKKRTHPQGKLSSLSLEQTLVQPKNCFGEDKLINAILPRNELKRKISKIPLSKTNRGLTEVGKFTRLGHKKDWEMPSLSVFFGIKLLGLCAAIWLLPHSKPVPTMTGQFFFLRRGMGSCHPSPLNT